MILAAFVPCELRPLGVTPDALRGKRSAEPTRPLDQVGKRSLDPPVHERDSIRMGCRDGADHPSDVEFHGRDHTE